MNFLKKLFNLNSAESTRKSMKKSYSKHFRAAQKGKIPLPEDMTPHLAGLYGALSTRYMVAGIPRSEVILWNELVPFILMSENDSISALAEYVVCIENPEDRERENWLKDLINNALRNIDTADENYKTMAVSAIIQTDIYWCGLLDLDIRKFLIEELKKYK